MKRILVMRPSKQDKRELAQFKDRYQFLFHDYSKQEAQKVFYQADSDLCRTVDDLVDHYGMQGIDGVLYATDYIGSSLGSILAHRLKLVGPNPEHILLCQHKYESRKAQQKYVSEAVPHFKRFSIADIGQDLADILFPLFIKPIKSVFSINACRVDSFADVEHAIKHREYDEYPELFEQFVKYFSPYTFKSDQYIAEGLLEGIQCTLEGFVANGSLHILGIVDSVMYPNTISFLRFEYPSRLPQSIQECMHGIAQRFIAGIGLDNSFFNIEFMYNSKTEDVHIIEVNPRMASQFADLYEKVDGKSSYELLLELATGQKPLIKYNEGQYNVAASCVLRTFYDQYVKKVPAEQEIERCYEIFPESRFELCCAEGKKLSDSIQDGKSYRYGLIHLGANSWPELYQAFEEAKKILNFQLEPV